MVDYAARLSVTLEYCTVKILENKASGVEALSNCNVGSHQAISHLQVETLSKRGSVRIRKAAPNWDANTVRWKFLNLLVT